MFNDRKDNFSRFPNDEGRGPPILLEFKFKVTRLDSNPNSFGTGPYKRLLFSCKILSPYKFPRALGKVPMSPLPLRLSLCTGKSPFVHTTPVQSQTGISGTLFVQAHPDDSEDFDDSAAAK